MTNYEWLKQASVDEQEKFVLSLLSTCDNCPMYEYYDHAFECDCEHTLRLWVKKGNNGCGTPLRDMTLGKMTRVLAKMTTCDKCLCNCTFPPIFCRSEWKRWLKAERGDSDG